MDLVEYTHILFRVVEEYLEGHLGQKGHRGAPFHWRRLDQAYGWVSYILEPALQVYKDILTLTESSELLISIEFGSHLDHCQGLMMRDHCYDDTGEFHETLDRLEQVGLEETFPHWERDIQKLLNGSRPVPGYNFPDLEEVYEALGWEVEDHWDRLSFEQMKEKIEERQLIASYPECEGCGEKFPTDEITLVEDWGYYCDSCFENNFHQCQGCGEYLYRLRDSAYIEWESERTGESVYFCTDYEPLVEALEEKGGCSFHEYRPAHYGGLCSECASIYFVGPLLVTT